MLAKIVYNCLEEVKCSGMLNTNQSPTVTGCWKISAGALCDKVNAKRKQGEKQELGKCMIFIEQCQI